MVVIAKQTLCQKTPRALEDDKLDPASPPGTCGIRFCRNFAASVKGGSRPFVAFHRFLLEANPRIQNRRYSPTEWPVSGPIVQGCDRRKTDAFPGPRNRRQRMRPAAYRGAAEGQSAARDANSRLCSWKFCAQGRGELSCKDDSEVTDKSTTVSRNSTTSFSVPLALNIAVSAFLKRMSAVSPSAG